MYQKLDAHMNMYAVLSHIFNSDYYYITMLE